MANLNETHPELFYVTPRPGGIVRIEIPDSASRMMKGSVAAKSVESQRTKPPKAPLENMTTSSPGYTSRNFRIQSALGANPWILFDDTLEDQTKPSSPLQSTIDILAIAITTVMLLAAEYGDISPSHLRWTKSYLENVRDEFGNIPPNVTGILNHLKLKYPDLVSYNNDTDESISEPVVDAPGEAVVEVTETADDTENAPPENVDALEE